MAGTKITVRTNGPLRVEGDFALCDASGNEFGLGGRSAISLCRCSLSNDKPFCAGRHRTGQFQSEVAARQLPPPQPKP